AAPPLASIGLTMGAALGRGRLQGFGDMVQSSPWASILTGAAAGYRLGGAWGAVGGAGLGVAAYNPYNGNVNKTPNATSTITGKTTPGKPLPSGLLGGNLSSGYSSNKMAIPGAIDTRTGKPFSSHANGLRRVPYDGYITELHEDEEVLTAQQARRKHSPVDPAGRGRSPQKVTRTIQIDKLVDKLIIQGGGKDIKQQATEIITEVYRQIKNADEILSSAEMGVLLG
ncbi:MAG: hypothetical protein ACYC0N_02245, partial [Carboxydocellales bacterium]